MHYALVALHVRIQIAAAYQRLNKGEEARAALAQALDIAVRDGFVLPFAEERSYLEPLLAEMPPGEFTAQIAALGQLGEKHRRRAACPAALAELTEREREVVLLAAQRLSNREIAERLNISVKTVEKHIGAALSQLRLRLSRSGFLRLFL